ncbi:two-component sensor histidine kinase [Paenibacillus sp. CCS19]|uniref:sensor histidine kinase n=1 Tax=Paenibacillus sp. CCS19 TaxID=3158387 RepID=UPI002566915F|nr:HAMP domain-containing sensor histidine kinase [Paenibacillus cellulosilyticus]GMK41261.1 two-component sensor histidine kinase [Paenibacillus cellulosilyticus]
MFWIAGLGVMTGVLALVALYRLKREIRRATRQLQQWNEGATAKKLDVIVQDRDMEALAEQINRQIDRTRQANAEKTRTENELKQAISHISHDIRTPMTSILGYVQLIESEEMPEAQKREYTAVVRKSALRLKALLEDFFELSVIESPDYALSMEKVVLNELVLESLVGYYEAFNQRHIEPILGLPEDEISMIADPSAVKRVIENLLTNALRYSDGDVSIELVRTADEASARLTIHNSAPRLQQSDLAYLFDRFYKADQQRTEKGTGLGLSIAKSLMQKMNGSLTAELKGGALFMHCEWREIEQDSAG